MFAGLSGPLSVHPQAHLDRAHCKAQPISLLSKHELAEVREVIRWIQGNYIDAHVLEALGRWCSRGATEGRELCSC